MTIQDTPGKYTGEELYVSFLDFLWVNRGPTPKKCQKEGLL